MFVGAYIYLLEQWRNKYKLNNRMPASEQDRYLHTAKDRYLHLTQKAPFIFPNFRFRSPNAKKSRHRFPFIRIIRALRNVSPKQLWFWTHHFSFCRFDIFAYRHLYFSGNSRHFDEEKIGSRDTAVPRRILTSLGGH